MINECGCNSGESEMSKDELFSRLNSIYSELGKLLSKVPKEISNHEEDHDKLKENPPVVFVRNFESFSSDSNDFSDIKKGSTVNYRAKRWKVDSLNDQVLRLKDDDGKTKTINRSQFSQYGYQVKD